MSSIIIIFAYIIKLNYYEKLNNSFISFLLLNSCVSLKKINSYKCPEYIYGTPDEVSSSLGYITHTYYCYEGQYINVTWSRNELPTSILCLLIKPSWYYETFKSTPGVCDWKDNLQNKKAYSDLEKEIEKSTKEFNEKKLQNEQKNIQSVPRIYPKK